MRRQEHSGKESQQKRTAEGGKHSSDQGQGKDGKKTDQGRNTYNKGESIPLKQTNRTNVEYRNNFPKLSSNYSRYESNPQSDRSNKQETNVVQAAARNSNSQLHRQNTNNLKNGKNSEPAPYAVVKSVAARLRYNQAKKEIPIF